MKAGCEQWESKLTYMTSDSTAQSKEDPQLRLLAHSVDEDAHVQFMKHLSCEVSGHVEVDARHRGASSGTGNLKE